MSMVDFQKALRLIEANANQGFFAGPRDPMLIASAERALGGKLPPTYREFVQKLGAGSFGAFEIYGVINEEFEKSSVPNGVWLTLKNRQKYSLPSDLVIIGSTDDGGYYCVEQCDGDESPVFVIYQRGVPIERQNREKVAQDFGEFLLNGVQDEIQAA